VEIVSDDLLRKAEECGDKGEPYLPATFRNFKFGFRIQALRQIALD